jgi:membrane protein
MARSQNQGGRTREAAPKGPADLGRASGRVAAKRTLKEYKDDDLQDRASR